MKGWTKINSFDNFYEAEIRRQFLQNAEIEAIVINAKDSLFLLGNIDLYVRDEDEKKALVIIEQMMGLTKINSFILKKPIDIFQNYLKQKGIETILKERELEKYILDNYELYIDNRNVNEVVPYLSGEAIEEWTKVAVCSRVRQTRYRVELLEAYEIDCFIVKKRDSDYHLEDISIFVENKNAEKAKQVLDDLVDWEKIRTYDRFEIAELKEDILGKNKIRAIIVSNEEKFDLYVLKGKVEEAENILKSTSEWFELQRYNTFIDAEAALLILQNNDIDASILTIQDYQFVIGGYAVYVEKRNLSTAIEILTEAKGGKIEAE